MGSPRVLQGVLCVFLGNAITLVPLILNAAPGTKYGVPFPVLARASFGVKVRKQPHDGFHLPHLWLGSSAYQRIRGVLAAFSSTDAAADVESPSGGHLHGQGPGL